MLKPWHAALAKWNLETLKAVGGAPVHVTDIPYYDQAIPKTAGGKQMHHAAAPEQCSAAGW